MFFLFWKLRKHTADTKTTYSVIQTVYTKLENEEVFDFAHPFAICEP